MVKFVRAEKAAHTTFLGEMAMCITWFPQAALELNTWIPYIVLLVGFLVSTFIEEKFGYRILGVIAVPLLALYTFVQPWILLIVLIAAVVLWGVGYLLQEWMPIYGRRLFRVLCGISIILTAPIFEFTGLGLDVVAFATLLPGIFAYNYLAGGPDKIRATGTMMAQTAGLIAFAYGLNIIGRIIV
ncbi:MAG TPA: poly-gamma-glutamate biosynthesis protein PgsC/CapC [Candidatus Paceibacterota bacterium]|nr:poly-gamma-glutamate biosynthesis protein PgsC/CapC [Candidatus Paceibacterota bacterium]